MVFCHADRVTGQEWLKVEEIVWVKVMEDKAKGSGFWKAVDSWDEARWEGKQAMRRADKGVAKAAWASKIAYKSEEGRRL